MNAKAQTAHSAQSIAQTLNHMGKLSMSREVIQLGATIEAQADVIRELQTNAEFMAHVWTQIRESGLESILEHGDPDGIDFVANRILAKVQS